jgi:hypothetical protein
VTVHELHTSVDAIDHFAKGVCIHQMAGSRSIESSCGSVEVGVVVQIGTDIVGELFEAALFVE